MPQTSSSTPRQQQNDPPCEEKAIDIWLQQAHALRTAGESQCHRDMALQASKPHYV